TLTPLEALGELLYFSPLLSMEDSDQSCASCHDPSTGFADPDNHDFPYIYMVSEGADGLSKGGRNALTSAYAGFSPILHREKGEYVGSIFWDGRATGYTLGDPLAEQAQGPPLNPVEMNIPRSCRT
ncbi:MAG: cytochrome-c peroxidase, partial [Desulfobacterales bacterium]